MRRRFFPTTTAAGIWLTVFLLFFCAVNSYAAVPFDGVVLSFADDGFSGEEQYLFNPTAATGDDGELSVAKLDLSGNSWDYSGDVDYQRRRLHDDMQTFAAYIDTVDGSDAEFYGFTQLSLDYDERDIALDGYANLCFGLSIDGGGNHYPVHITLETTKGTAESSLYITTRDDERNYSIVYIDINDIDGQILSLNIKVSYNVENTPDIITCTMPYLTTNSNVGFVNAENFTTNRLSSEIGTVALTSGKVTPNSSGMAYLNAKFVSTDRPGAGSSAYFEVKLSGVTQGNLTLSTLYAGTSSEQRQYSKKISLTAPDGIYTIPIDVYGDIHSFALQFDNVECDNFFYIDSIQVYSGAKAPLAGNSDIGSVSSIRRAGDKITFVGSMERDYVTQFTGNKIYFYAIPGSTPDNIQTAVELGSIKVSTMFEYTLELSGRKSIGDTFMFFAAIKTTDADGNETILPLSRPRYADADPLHEINLSNVGLYNAATVGAFESNVSHVMVDVPLDTLISKSDSSSASVTYISYDGGDSAVHQTALDSAFLKQLNRDIEFYSSAGIEVYLRLTEFSAIDGMTGTTSDASSSEQASVLHNYAAVVRFLASRYSGIAGIVLGTGVNSSEIGVGSTFDDLASYSATVAELCRITYNAASVYIPDILVIVPFVPNDGGEWVSERTLAVMLSDRLSDIGHIPWAFMYTFYSADDDLSAITSLDRLLYDLEIEGAGATMFFYQPSNDELLKDYFEYLKSIPEGEEIPEYKNYVASAFGEICDLCSAYRARAVFLSLDGISVKNDHNFYSDLKSAGQSDRFVYEFFAETADENESFASKYTLWDFSDKYYPLDWIAGGGVSSCATEPSTRFTSDPSIEYTRVLRSTFETEDSSGVAGITLRNFRKQYNFSEVDAIDFTFAVETAEVGDGFINLSDDQNGATVVFVIGTDDYRAEYYADNVTCGEIQRLRCDLTGYEYRNTIDYVGIMVYADYEVVLDLSAVSVSSKTLAEESLAEMFSADKEEPATISNRLSVIAFIIIISVITVMAVILLIRRDREEDELREAAIKASAQNRRSSRSRSVYTDHRRNQ